MFSTIYTLPAKLFKTHAGKMLFIRPFGDSNWQYLFKNKINCNPTHGNIFHWKKLSIYHKARCIECLYKVFVELKNINMNSTTMNREIFE